MVHAAVAHRLDSSHVAVNTVHTPARRYFTADAHQLPPWLPERIPPGKLGIDTFLRLAGYLRGQYGLKASELACTLRRVASTRCKSVSRKLERKLDAIAKWAARKTPRRGGRVAVVDEFAHWIDAQQWTGRQGLDRRAVALAILAIVVRTKKRAVALAVRDLAIEAGISTHQTVSHALKWLREQEVLWLLKRDPNDGDAHVYEVRVPEMRGTKSNHTYGDLLRASPSGSILSREEGDAVRDAFRHGALGRSALAVLEAVMTGKHTKDEIVAAVPKSPKTIQRALTTLLEVGLLVEETGEFHRGPATFAQVAERIGSAGKTAAQRGRYEAERRRYHSPEGKREREQARAERKKAQDQLWRVARERGFPHLVVNVRHGEKSIEGREAWSHYIWRAATSRKDLIGAVAAMRKHPRVAKDSGQRSAIATWETRSRGKVVPLRFWDARVEDLAPTLTAEHVTVSEWTTIEARLAEIIREAA